MRAGRGNSIVLINEVVQSRSRPKSSGESERISFTYLPSGSDGGKWPHGRIKVQSFYRGQSPSSAQ